MVFFFLVFFCAEIYTSTHILTSTHTHKGDEGKVRLPQTAQVAAQQGAYVARLFNRQYMAQTAQKTPSLPADLKSKNLFLYLWVKGNVQAKPFKFLNLGVLAYIGGRNAVAKVMKLSLISHLSSLTMTINSITL